MNFLSVTGLIICLSSVVCALLVLLSRPINVVKFCWVLFTVAVAVWGFGFFEGFYSIDKTSALFWFRFLNVSAILIPLFFLQFSLFFTSKKKNAFKILVVNYVFSLGYVCVALFFPEGFIPSTVAKFSLLNYPTAGLLYWFFPVIYSFQWGFGTYLLYKKYISSTGSVREQTKYTLLGVGLAYIGGGSTFFGVVGWNFYPYPVALVPFYVILISYAIIRYRLMDIRVAITSAGIFLVVYSLTFGVPIFLYKKEQYFWALLSMGFFATPAPFIYDYFRRRTEKNILRDEYAKQDALLDVANSYPDKKTVDEITRLLVESVTRLMTIEQVAVFLFDGKDYSRKDFRGNKQYLEVIPGDSPIISLVNTMGTVSVDELAHIGQVEKELFKDLPVAMAIPLRQKNKVIGVLFLGPKSEGAHYSDRDIRTLKLVASTAAEAIETAAGIEKRERSIYEELQDRHLRNLSTMGAGISHQMYNRMNMINAALENISDIFTFGKEVGEKEKEEILNWVKDAQEHVKNSKHMTEGLKVASRKSEEKKSVSLKDLVERTKGMAHQTKHKNYEFEFLLLNNEDLPIFCCEAEMQEVFFNAIDNSLDAIKIFQKSTVCPKGFVPRITVAWRRDRGDVVIEVADNGIGFKPEDLEKAFTPHHTTKGLDKGTGLGLYVLRELVRKQGGSVEIVSEYLKGALLRVRLPLSKEAE